MLETKHLRVVPLFQDLPAARLKELCLGSILERYEKGAALFHQGQRAEAIWIILRGWVHLVRSPTDNGARAAVLFTITPREALCGISALESGVYNLSAVAATNCQAIRISGAVFRDALQREPAFAYEALRLCTRRLQNIALQYGAIAEPVSHRVIRAMLRLQEQFGRTLPVTHRELAQMAWTTTESAIRVVRRLKQRGYVTGTRNRLQLSHPEKLARELKV